jgi:hypothetical protein
MGRQICGGAGSSGKIMGLRTPALAATALTNLALARRAERRDAPAGKFVTTVSSHVIAEVQPDDSAFGLPRAAQPLFRTAKAA